MSLLTERKADVTESLFGSSALPDSYLHDVEERAYVSRKVSKIKWKPEGMDEYSSCFVTGSYDDPTRNTVDLWSYSQRNDNVIGLSSGDFSPSLMSRIQVDGNVTGLNFFSNKNLLCYSSHSGTVGVVKVIESGTTPALKVEHKWTGDSWLGSDSVTCSALDCHDNEILVGSLDGRLAILLADSGRTLGTLCSSSVPVHNVRYVGNQTAASASLLGTITLWDLRSDSENNTFPLSRVNRVGVTSIVTFPTEPHMLTCGGRNGTVTVFDLRHLPLPVQVFKTSPSPIAELCFHPTRHSILFSLSSHGEIWQWSNFYQLFSSTGVSGNSTMPWTNPTTNTSIAAAEMSIVSPKVKSLLHNDRLFTNCIDLNKDRLLCGTDHESVIAIKSLLLN